MLSQWVRGAGAAALFFCASAAGASAQQSHPRLGWLPELSGSCFEARNSAGALIDRQCYQTQFGHVVRAAITREDFQGESVLGYSRERDQLEMYAWNSEGRPAIFTPSFTYDTREYVFEGAPENGVATRSAWRRTADGFDVVTQRQQGRTWADSSAVHYRRAGDAPRAFSAGISVGVTRYGLGWLDRIAGRCYTEVEPNENSGNRGCFAYQYTNALRQTWYYGSNAPTGESVLFRSPDGSDVRFFHWDASGAFGIGESAWVRGNLVSVSDTSRDRRVVLNRRGHGFELTSERLSEGAVREWEFVRHTRYRMQ